MTTPTPSFEEIMRAIEEREKAAYQKGWDDAITKIVAVASTTVSAPQMHVTTHEPQVEVHHGPSVIETVFQIIKETPGLRGADVIRQLVVRNGIDRKAADRTGRTSLSRLRSRGRIVQREQLWYPKGHEDTKEKETGPVVGSPAP